MSISVQFQGAEFIRASAATAVDTSAFTGPPLVGATNLAFVGTSKGGEPRVLKEWSSLRDMFVEFYDGNLLDAARLAFNSSDDPLVQGLPQKIYTYKTNLSTKSTLTLQNTSAALAACHQLTNAGPYNVSPGDILNVTADLGGPHVVSFRGTNASHTGGATSLPTVAASTLVYSLNGGPLQTITFGTEGTVAAAAILINLTMSGGFASASGANLKIESTQYGSGSALTIDASSTALTELGLTASPYPSAGPNDAVDLNVMTAAEIKTRLETFGAPDVVLDLTTTPPTLCSPTLGAGSTLTIAASTPASLNTVLGATAAAYAGAASGAPVDVVRLDSRNWGLHTNGIKVTAVDPSPTSAKRIITLTQIVDGTTQQQVSPTLGEKRRFSIDHIGAGTTVTMAITATNIVLDSDVVAEDLTLEFVDYPTLDVLLAQIDASPYYDIDDEEPLNQLFAPGNLDWVSAVDLTTGTPEDVYSSVYDVVNWINTSAGAIAAVRLPTGATQFDSFSVVKTLLGAVEGTEATSDYTNALNALANVHANTLVPLVSEDNLAGGNSVVFSAVAVAFAAHCKDKSKVSPDQDERRCWIGVKGAKAAILSLRNTLLTYDSYATLVVDRQRVPKGRSGNLTYLPEWSTAVMGAAMRAGLEVGEPLVWKTMKSFGTERDWNPDTPGEIEDLITNNITITFKDRVDGLIRFDRVLTLYGADNDALREESIFSGILVFAYDWRRSLQRLIVGRKGSLATVGTLTTESEQFFATYGPREQGGIDFLIDSTDENGAPLAPWRNLVIQVGVAPFPSDVAFMQVEVTLVSGVNFLFQNLVAVPGSISVVA